MKISEVYPEYVFQRLGKGLRVVAVDFNKSEFVELRAKTVGQVQQYIVMPNIKFFQIEPEETTTA